MARYFPNRKVILCKVSSSLDFFPTDIFEMAYGNFCFSSGRRETPHLDARMNKLNRYSIEANLRNLTTEAPDPQLFSSTFDYDNSSTSRNIPPSTTSAPKIYESGEDLNLDSSSNNEEDDDDDDDDNEEDDDFDVEGDELDEEEEEIDMEEKTNMDNVGLAVTNLGEGTNIFRTLLT